MTYALSCCSTVDLNRERLASLDVAWVPFHFEVDGVDYEDNFGDSIPIKEFYTMMENGADTKTSQVSIGQFVEHFNTLLKTTNKILHVCFSSGLSGSYNSAQLAAAQIMEANPQAQIEIVDSLAASAGYGLFIQALAEMRDSGLTIEELRDWAIANRLKVHHWFYSTDLTFYVKGGRVSKTAGLVGSLLNICPLLNVDFEGYLIPRTKVRTRKKAAKAAFDKMVEHAQDGMDYSGRVFISHSACLDDATLLAQMINEAFPCMHTPVELFDIGTTIGSHTGPGTVALFFWGDERVD